MQHDEVIWQVLDPDMRAPRGPLARRIPELRVPTPDASLDAVAPEPQTSAAHK